MIEKVSIKNYKSVQDIEIELGRFNVFIGENGCGKSNILEAITLGAASASDKLDSEFLFNRGIRVTEPRFMRSAFQKKNVLNPIKLSFSIDELDYSCELTNDNKPYSKWINKSNSNSEVIGKEIVDLLFSKKRSKSKEIDPELSELRNSFNSLLSTLDKLSGTKEEKENLRGKFKSGISSSIEKQILNPLSNFVIYSPEESSLRSFEKDGQIEPLGRRGEGLFKLLKTFVKERSNKKIKLLKEHLRLIDWFVDFEISDNKLTEEKNLNLKDRFLAKELDFIDQRSTNEGFLFLLFYIALLISDETPDFFAIDNIENGLNPKLCERLTKLLNQLSEQNEKQVILATHNPSVLNGIDLKDPDQRLFMIFRNKLGHTKFRRITLENEIQGSDIRLSEAFLKGYIGGLSKAF
ncbi:MAG: AAA family ATPase [Bacteroidetes bacterium]|nr:AAA family ATPase [Bacteroidota bacterium]